MRVLDVLDEIAQTGKRDAAAIELADVDQKHGHRVGGAAAAAGYFVLSPQPHNTTHINRELSAAGGEWMMMMMHQLQHKPGPESRHH